MRTGTLLSILPALAALLVVDTSSASVPDGFDRSAASEALASVSVQTCKRARGPTGQGHVLVTFGPSGVATSAVTDKEPFRGTPVGHCVAKQFKKVRIPKFSGPTVTLGKTFTID